MNADTIITYKDLKRSGPLVMALFASNYPDGMSLQDMLDSQVGWIRTSAKLVIEDRKNE